MHLLRSLFDWLDHHPGSYGLLVTAASLALMVMLGRRLARDHRGAADPALPGWRDALVLGLFLFAWRWPFLFVPYEYNPDESQLIAGALTLARDPVFWRAVDGGSSGPLNYFLLAPWAWAGLPVDYFTARLTCLLLTWGALFACLRTLARAHGRAIAWVGLLPGAVYFATVNHPEFTNLSTEHLPLLLVAVAFGWLAGRPPGDRWRLWAGCLAAGALPWAKLQAAPLGLVLLGWAGWQVLREPGLTSPQRWRRAGEVVLAAALPALVFVSLAAATGQLEAAWRRYVLQNLFYVGDGTATPAGQVLQLLWLHAREQGCLPVFLFTTGAGLLAAGGYGLWRRVRPSALLVAAAVLTVTAGAAVIAPRRDYLHYALLLTVPLILWFGAALGNWWRQLADARSRLVLAVVGLVAGLLPLVPRAWPEQPPVYGGFAFHWRHPRANAAAVVRALAGPGDSLGTWGWGCYLHAESGLPQATRDGTTLWSIQDNPQLDYHRAVYLADLERNRPAVFADAVGPGAGVFTNRAREAHEIFPQLAAYVSLHYTLVCDLQDVRLYVRNDAPALPRARLRQLLAQGHAPRGDLAAPPTRSLDKLPREVIAGRPAARLLPPTQVDWWLEPDTGAATLEFVYNPAELEADGSHGVELIVEVVDAQATREVYRRFLNPVRQPGDRGPQQVRVSLPAFGADATLRLRVEPAFPGNDAPDWIYLSGLQLHPRQPAGAK